VGSCLAKNDLYARLALKTLPAQCQLDLSCWVERLVDDTPSALLEDHAASAYLDRPKAGVSPAHPPGAVSAWRPASVLNRPSRAAPKLTTSHSFTHHQVEAHALLSTLAQGDTLPRFASHALPSWHALGRLARVAAEIGCDEEAAYGALTRPEELLGALQRHEPTATKLQRLLTWQPAPSATSAFAGPGAQGGSGCRQTRQQADASRDGQAAQAQRARTVRLRFGAQVTEHALNWDEMW
jgi:hypothetical protein